MKLFRSLMVVAAILAFCALAVPMTATEAISYPIVAVAELPAPPLIEPATLPKRPGVGSFKPLATVSTLQFYPAPAPLPDFDVGWRRI